MAEANPSNNGRFHFQHLFSFLFRPRHTFEQVLSHKATWLTPMLVISVLIVGQVLFNNFRNPAVPTDVMPVEGMTDDGMTVSGGGDVTIGGDMGGEVPVDPGATSSGWMSTALPVASKLAGLWLGWFLLTVILFVSLVVSGNQGNFTQALNLTAWSSLPFAVQSLAQVLFAFAYPAAGTTPQGLAGLAAGMQGTGGQILGLILQQVDVFLIWQVILLMVGTVLMSQIPAGKVRWLVTLSVVIFLLLAVLPSFGLTQFSLLQNAAQPQY